MWLFADSLPRTTLTGELVVAGPNSRVGRVPGRGTRVTGRPAVEQDADI